VTSIPADSFAAAYGPDDKPASKTIGSGSNASTTYYIYDEASGNPQTLIEELQSGTTAAVLNAYGFAADGIRSRYLPSSGGFYYVYQYDPMGNYLQRESAGEYNPGGEDVLDTALYDSYGHMTADLNSSTGGAASRGESIGFGGQWGNYTDPETGLLCLGHRYYEPGTGRFLNRDPIGYAGGENLYGYAGNNPINEIDPEGTDGGFFTWLIHTFFPTKLKLATPTLTSNLAEKNRELAELTQGGDDGDVNGAISAQSYYHMAAKAPQITKATNDVEESAGETMASAVTGPEEEGVVATAEAAPRLLNPPIQLTPSGLAHVLDRHSFGGVLSAGKSIFNRGENITDLIEAATHSRITVQYNGNLARVYDAGRDIGVNRTTGLQTRVMTVITRPNGNLVTAFPGR
jgi:RHS repeat-associated protein